MSTTHVDGPESMEIQLKPTVQEQNAKVFMEVMDQERPGWRKWSTLRLTAWMLWRTRIVRPVKTRWHTAVRRCRRWLREVTGVDGEIRMVWVVVEVLKDRVEHEMVQRINTQTDLSTLQFAHSELAAACTALERRVHYYAKHNDSLAFTDRQYERQLERERIAREEDLMAKQKRCQHKHVVAAKEKGKLRCEDCDKMAPAEYFFPASDSNG